MADKLQIQANLSIVRSGGELTLATVIEEIDKALRAEFPNADIVVRKGFFQTIDGIWASDPLAEEKVKDIVENVRDRVLLA